MGLKLKAPKLKAPKVPKWDPHAFAKTVSRQVDVTRKGSVAQRIALTPAAPTFALGGIVNKASGGKTTTLNVWKAAEGKKPAPTYSTLTKAASGFQGQPGAGTWRAPVLNRSTTKAAGQVAAAVVQDVAKPVASAAANSLFGVDLATLGWIAAGIAGVVVLGPPLVAGVARAAL